ncbi:uncharacterized protein SAPINGB_P003112 [Magnusiomyces paraingens]|uniref:Uncharacterized protein n=1 Tax=Magnusiomyces paraingens TaxID=2606893 RepID=A0A5E8BIH8_9ASCO|nr:uncharacterized protein SAPINGB_P003112 [Saprochaete ingens]VVT51486.1 unnamed protein product [Saprochaete ingens]
MSGLHKTTIGAQNVAVYQVAGTNTSRSLPDWIARRRKRSLKNDVDYANRVELIQEFGFDEAALRLKVTRDGQFCMATGTYKPQIRVYELAQAGLKFERHTDAENVDFEILSQDWTKSVHLQNDRTIEFQAQGGIHAKTRIPKFGRALAYNPNNCDIIVAATGNQVYRLNADQGRFLAPYEMDFEQGPPGSKSEGGVNCVAVNPQHSLLGFGLENGTAEFWDPRSRRRVAQLSIGGHGHGVGSGVTALSFRNDGLNVGFGTYEGNTLLFDMRASEPYVQKDQGYDLPIKKIGWIESDNLGGSGSKVFTADRKIVKIWDRVDGKPYTAMEPAVDINDVIYIEDSGMFLMANEGRHMHAYYIPSIGPAPGWCSYLENITEELESTNGSQSSVYENFRFVEKDVLKSLHLDQYIGTNVVRSYMHGYFIHQDLYDQARSIANPYAYQEHREREIRKRIEKERESRIRSSANVPKVKANKALAQRLCTETEDSEPNLAADDRFKVLFEDPDFEVDETSKEFRGAAAGGKTSATVRKSAEERERMRALTAAEISDEEREAQLSKRKTSHDPFDSDDDNHIEDEESSEEDEEEREKRAKKLAKKQQKKNTLPEMRAVDELASGSRRRHGKGSEDDDGDAAFEDFYEETNREEKEREHMRENVHRTRVGELEYTFVPEKKEPKPRKRAEQQGDDEDEARENPKGDRGRTKQRFDGRRRASKNAFRGM